MYECSGEPGRVTGVVVICPVNVLTGSDEAAAESVDTLAAARAIAELKVQPRPVSLAYEASPVMDIILGAAKEGASLYAVTDPAGITHRVWEVKREDAVAAIRAMGKEPFNFTVAALFPAALVSGAAPQVPMGLLTHQIARWF